jgi:hypothetical protein
MALVTQRASRLGAPGSTSHPPGRRVQLFGGALAGESRGGVVSSGRQAWPACTVSLLQARAFCAVSIIYRNTNHRTRCPRARAAQRSPALQSSFLLPSPSRHQQHARSIISQSISAERACQRISRTRMLASHMKHDTDTSSCATRPRSRVCAQRSRERLRPIQRSQWP